MNHHFPKLQSPIALVVAAALAGCSSSMISPLKMEAEQNAAAAGNYLESMRNGKKVESAPPASVAKTLDSKIYIPVRKVGTTKTAKASQHPELSRQITVNRTFTSAQELAERITTLAGIPVVVAPDVTAIQPGTQVGGLAAAGLAGVGLAAAGGLPNLPPIPGVGQGPLGSTAAQAYNAIAQQAGGFPANLSYTGSLSGFLDVASSRIGIAWAMEDGQIRLFRYMSKTFRLTALPGDTSMDAKVGTTSGSSSGSGGMGGTTVGTQNATSTQNAGVNFAGLSVWKGVEESVKAMLSPAGKIVVASSLGTITVTDTPAVVAAVESFVEQQNSALSRQVVVNVRVLSVDLSNSDNYGINWDLVYRNISQNFGLTFKTAASAIAGAGALAFNVLNTAGLTSWAGSQAMIEALSSQGRVSTITSASVTTINNQPAPIQVGRQTSYVATSSSSITTGVATTSMTPGVVNSGFSMSLLPHIIDERRMLLQYAVDMSALLSLKTLTAGTTIMQTPDVDTRNSLQRVMVNSGDTLVVAGFENSEVNATSSGVVGAETPAVGGSVLAKKSKTMIVILIQPIIAD